MRDPSHPDLRLEGVAIRSWSSDKLRVVMTATRLDLFREVGTPGEVVATDAGVLIVADGSRLSAPMVTGNIFSGQFEGKGGVRMVGPDSLAAATPTVAFDRALGLAASDAGVVLTRPGLRLEAESFSYEVGDEHATFVRARTDFDGQPSPRD